MGDSQALDENIKILTMEVVPEKTTKGGETSHIASNPLTMGGKCRQAMEPSSISYASRMVWLIRADDLDLRWIVQATRKDGLDSSDYVPSSHDDRKFVHGSRI